MAVYCATWKSGVLVAGLIAGMPAMIDGVPIVAWPAAFWVIGAKARAIDLSPQPRVRRAGRRAAGVRVERRIGVARDVAQDLVLAGRVGEALDAHVHRVGGGVVVEPDVLHVGPADQLVGLGAVGAGHPARAAGVGQLSGARVDQLPLAIPQRDRVLDAAIGGREVVGDVPGQGDRVRRGGTGPRQYGGGRQGPSDIADTNHDESPSTLWLISSRTRHTVVESPVLAGGRSGSRTNAQASEGRRLHLHVVIRTAD